MNHVDALFVKATAELFPFGGVATINDNFSGRQYLITAKHVVETAVARVLPGETVRICSDQPPNVVKTPSSHIPPDQAKHKTTRQNSGLMARNMR